MKYESAVEVIQALKKAYYDDHNVDNAINCVTDDIRWIGTEKLNTISGKREFKKYLKRVINYSKDFVLETDKVIVDPIEDTVALVTIYGRQILPKGNYRELMLRCTGCCVKIDDSWFVKSIHFSVPNTEVERQGLVRTLDDTRKKERALLSSIPGGVAIYRVKVNNQIDVEYISESFAKLLGFENDKDIIIKNGKNVIEQIHKDDREKVFNAVLEAISDDTDIACTYRVRTKNNEYKLMRVDATVISNVDLGQDDVSIIYAVNTPVSEESQQIIEDQKRYLDIMNVLDIAYWEWSKDNGFFHSDKYNDYAISSESDEYIWSNEYSNQKYIHPDDVELMNKFTSEDSPKCARKSVVVRTLMKDGSYKWTEMFAFAKLSDKNELVRLITIMRDLDQEWIKQREQLEKALVDAKQANEAKTAFLSRVSHDMRTPLNGILGLTKLIKDKISDDNINSDLSELENSGIYLLNLINDTLDVNKIERGKLELHPSVCEEKSLLDNIIRITKPMAEAKNIQFIVNSENMSSEMLYLDVSRFEQILVNIVGNAAKFTAEGGKITLSITNLSNKDGVMTDEIMVEDTGIGMRKEFLPHIFEAFTQEDATRTSTTQGTGLGMSITKTLVELMGGDIAVESEFGKGTCVTIFLPFHIATEEQVEKWSKNKTIPGDISILEGKRVLLCEDHPLNAQIATRLLEKKKIAVELAQNGKIGVDMFKASDEFYYDAVLMDIRMPVMDGISATKKIRSLKRKDSKKVPIIAMTANAFEEDVRQTKEAGMTAHLAKPIDVKNLFQTLASQINKGNLK